MLKRILARIKTWLASFKTDETLLGSLVAAIKASGYSVVDVDPKTESILVDLGKPICTLVFVSKDRASYAIESTIVFVPDIINLSTLSHLAHTAITGGFGISGVVPTGNGSLKIYVGKTVDFRAIDRISIELENMKECVKMMVGYINYRTNQLNTQKLDLSMFEEIDDLEGFDPQMLGEQKDFIYRSWQRFAEEVAAEAEDVAEAADALRKISACAEFESKNSMHLSEIGDMIKDELLWNRSILTMARADDKYNVN